MAVTDVISTPIRPIVSGRKRFWWPTLFACRTASASTSLAGPGTALLIVSTIVDVIPECPNAAAKPTSTTSPCTRTSDVAKASDREWLVPSARRKRTNALSSRRSRPVRASVSFGSSSMLSHVSGTRGAVLTTPPARRRRWRPGRCAP
jgi:hypothetical protein